MCTLRLLFRHTWLISLTKSEKLTQSPRKDVISKNHFHHFFSKFCWGHVKSTFSNLPEIFLSKVGYFRSETENNQTITLLSKKTQNVRCTHRLQLWEIWQKSSSPNSNNFAQRPKTLSRISSFQRNVLKCSSEHFESSFDNPASIFSLFVQIFLLEVQRGF